MPRRLLPRLLLALLAAMGMASESAAKVAHGLAHREEARHAQSHASTHAALGSNSRDASNHVPGIEGHGPDSAHASLHATAVASQLTPAWFVVHEVAVLLPSTLRAVADRSLAFSELARPPGGTASPTRPRGPPIA